LLPCWRRIYEQTGEKPIVVVSREFANVFRGTSYIEPDVVNGHWYANLSQAIKMAKIKYGKFTVTQCNGVGYASHYKGDTFGEMMWDAAGFTGMYGQLPMVFDRRNKVREQKLIDEYVNKKPLLLFNLTGFSSPLPAMSEIHNRLRRYLGKFNLLHIGSIKSEAVFDLLGLYDIAAGLITIDTATLHLAAASTVPLLAYCRGGPASAIAKPGSMVVYYNEAHRRLDAIDEFIQSLEPLCCKSLT
jgi:hypothetical protein